MSGRPHRPRILSRLWEAILMVTLWRIGALRRRRPEPPEHEVRDPSRRETGAREWAQLVVPGMLVLCAARGRSAFVALFVLDPNTQLLGLCLGAALALLAGALVLAGRFLVPAGDEGRAAPDVRRPRGKRGGRRAGSTSGLDGITRRRLLGGAAGIAGAGIAAAVVIPVVALGPGVEEQLSETPWRAGRALVDEEGKPIFAADVERGELPDRLSARARNRTTWAPPWCVVRVDPATLALPAERACVGAEGHPRLLEDLHARGLRDLAVPFTVESHHRVARAGTGLSVPLLDVRRARRRQRRVRSRRTGAAAAAAADRRIRCAASQAGRCPARSGRPGGETADEQARTAQRRPDR